MNNLTINEIASLSGVSKATVSRVINNHPYVNKETRSRVLKIMSEHDYQPNDTAQLLAATSTKVVGILVSDIRWSHYTHGVYYVEDEFAKYGYMCITVNTGYDPEVMAEKVKYLCRRKVDAIVLIGSVFQNTTVQNAIMVYASSIPVAICNGYLDGPNIYGVVCDECGGISDIVKILADKGHRNFAFIYNVLSPSTKLKIRGFEHGFQQYVKDGFSSIIDAGVIVADIKAKTAEAISGSNPADAIIYSADFLAFAGIQTIQELGMEIPRDVAVAAVNNSRFSEISYPSLTVVDNKLYDTCTIAVRNLLSVLNGDSVNHRMQIFSEIVERKST